MYRSIHGGALETYLHTFLLQREKRLALTFPCSHWNIPLPQLLRAGTYLQEAEEEEGERKTCLLPSLPFCMRVLWQRGREESKEEEESLPLGQRRRGRRNTWRMVLWEEKRHINRTAPQAEGKYVIHP